MQPWHGHIMGSVAMSVSKSTCDRLGSRASMASLDALSCSDAAGPPPPDDPVDGRPGHIGPLPHVDMSAHSVTVRAFPIGAITVDMGGSGVVRHSTSSLPSGH
ncbi:MAG: hypothetical protein QOJ19_4406 [Acidimicrobiia bacterium]|jgi:hypothetical protein|nr:hypothetical protein [Acidimicrobiia bacterium]